MKKEIITVYTQTVSYNWETIAIDDFIRLVVGNKEKGATHVSIESELDSGEVDIRFSLDREETDEEFAARLEKIEQYRKQIMANRLEQYERLKKELGL